MLRGQHEEIHSSNSHCSIPKRKLELLLTGWEDEWVFFQGYWLHYIKETPCNRYALNTNAVKLMIFESHSHKRCKITWWESRKKINRVQ